MQEEKTFTISQTQELPEWVKTILNIAEEAKKNRFKKNDITN